MTADGVCFRQRQMPVLGGLLVKQVVAGEMRVVWLGGGSC